MCCSHTSISAGLTVNVQWVTLAQLRGEKILEDFVLVMIAQTTGCCAEAPSAQAIRVCYLRKITQVCSNRAAGHAPRPQNRRDGFPFLVSVMR
jgi:hypothetical protein